MRGAGALTSPACVALVRGVSSDLPSIFTRVNRHRSRTNEPGFGVQQMPINAYVENPIASRRLLPVAPQALAHSASSAGSMRRSRLSTLLA